MRPAAVLLALTLAGCHSVRTDLSAPCVWRELDAEPVVVVGEDDPLPIVVSDVPDERWAANFLAMAIEETCGRRPDVLVELRGQSARLEKGLFIGNVTANFGEKSCTVNATYALDIAYAYYWRPRLSLQVVGA